MTPELELAELEQAIDTTEGQLVTARADLDAAFASLVLDRDGDGLVTARSRVTELRDLLLAQQTRLEVLRHRITSEEADAA